MRFTKVSFVAICALSGASLAFGQVLYHGIRILNNDGSSPLLGVAGMNDAGVLAGHKYTSSGASYPCVWSPAIGMIDILDYPENCGGALATDLNDAGDVVGTYSCPPQGNHAFVWTFETGMIPLGKLPGGDGSQATAINNQGIIAGHSGSALLPNDNKYYSGSADLPFIGTISTGIEVIPGFAWNAYPSDINNRGQVTGGMAAWPLFPPCYSQGFIWDPVNGLFLMPMSPDGFCVGTPREINELGQVCGGFNVPGNSKLMAYLWDPVAGYTKLGKPPGPEPYSEAFGLNDMGQVVGSATGDYSGFEFHGFLWDAQNGMRFLEDIVDASTRKFYWPGYPSGLADINNKGQMIGGFYQPIGAKSFGFRFDPFIPGDMNCDGTVDAGDLPVFLKKLAAGGGPPPPNLPYEPVFDECGWWIGDINQDGVFDEQDLWPFLAKLPPKTARKP